jgi:hypothetical protein
VSAFLAANEDVLAARVVREVRNKLETGLKTPLKPSTKTISLRMPIDPCD